MDKDEEEAYFTHLFDQIGSAQSEMSEEFLERAEDADYETLVNIPEEVFEDSYIGSLVPWLADESMREHIFSCQHLSNPQPVTVFFENPNFLSCSECADAIETYKDVKSQEESTCDLCSAVEEVAWVFASYQYFTLTGQLCQTCRDSQKLSIGYLPEE